MNVENASNELQLTFPGSYPTLNKVIESAKQHWSRYKREKRQYTQMAHVDALSQYRGPMIESRCSFQFNWYLKDALTDPDNVMVGQKYIFDGLVNAGVIKDDGMEILGGGITHFFTVDAANPRCVVTILIDAQ